MFVERLEDRCVLSYQITDLGTLPGFNASFALGVNDSGQVVGYSINDARPYHAFLWDAATGMQDLGTLPGDSYSYARGINNSGQVVGSSGTSIFFGPGHAFVWDAATGMQDLGTLPGDSYSDAYGINDYGQVVGYSSGSIFGPPHAFLWDAANGMQYLGTLPGGSYSFASGINNTGQVVGWSGHAFLWDAATGMQDLGTLPGDTGSAAYGINDFGQVVGDSSGTSSNHGFLWDAATGMQDLGTLPGDTGSAAYGINDYGQVVGDSFLYDPITENYYYRPFLWQNGTMTDLNALIPPDSGWTLWYANAINNAGQTVGSGLHNGERAYLLTPESFAVTAPANAMAGTAFDVTVSALGAWDSVDTGYTGTVPPETTASAAAHLSPTTVSVDPLFAELSGTDGVAAWLRKGRRPAPASVAAPTCTEFPPPGMLDELFADPSGERDLGQPRQGAMSADL
jgi:probable HAF family extracellular repeat protein